MSKKETFSTPKGTILYLMDIKGKPYLQVQERIIWFREERPTWRIETEIVFHDKDRSVVKASIKDDSGAVIASAHKSEDVKGFNDHLEKAETSAIGRALALCGFGTQFTALELDEGTRLADSPPTARPSTTQAQAPRTGDEPPWPSERELNDNRDLMASAEAPVAVILPNKFKVPAEVAKRFKPTFGKYANKPLGEQDPKGLSGYIKYLEKSSQETGKPMSQAAKDFIANARIVIESSAMNLVVEGGPKGFDATEELPF